MILLSWQDAYAVGVGEIDQEHQYLFGLINQFHDKFASGESQQQILRVLNRLVIYAERHFQHEEDLMRKCGYPRLEQHQLLHEQLVTSIFALNEDLSLGRSKVDFDTLRFLKNWLLAHILKEDMDIGDFVKRQAAQARKAARDDVQGEVKNPSKDSSAAPGKTEPAPA